MATETVTVGPTLASSVYDRLRVDILAGHFRPSEKLRIEDLRERYQTGASPIREALNRLAAEGLVTLADQKGFRVPPISVEELVELTRSRCLLNEILIREAIALATEADDEALVLAHFRMSRTPERNEDDPHHVNPRWAALHMEFHAALVSPCRSKWLLNFDRTLSEQALRYRSATAGKEFPLRDVQSEHEAMLKAFLARDAETTLRLLNEHIQQTANMIVESERSKARKVAA